VESFKLVDKLLQFDEPLTRNCCPYH